MKMRDKTSRTQKTLRPTTGKVREALFNILRDRIQNARFLDLYAGSGLMGIEALRNGAGETVFVEARKTRVRAILDLIQKNRLSDKAQVVPKKALSFIELEESGQRSFDIIFLDPPYHTDEILHVLHAIDSSTILKRDGIVVSEHFKKRELPDSFNRLRKTKEHTYGDTILSFYEYK